MKVKKKICKGNYKAPTHGCGELVYKRTYGLCNSCYADWLLNTDEGQEKLNKATLKATKYRRELEQAVSERKHKRSLQYLKTNTTNVLHKYVRERDKGKPCISCGTDWDESFQAGHFYKAELYSTLKYNEYNIHGQCQACNLRKEGNLNGYDINLPKRIGQDRYKNLKELAKKDKLLPYKWDREELNNIRETYKNKLKELVSL